MTKKLYAIFVNFNSGTQLQDGVIAVLKSPTVTGIIVVDNGSKDNSLKNIGAIKNTKKITIIKNTKNLGFYKALNIGIRKALEFNADMVMPLDFDLDFNYDFITKLSKVDAGMVAPALKSMMGGRWIYSYGGRINWRNGSSTHFAKTKPIKNIGQVTSSTNRSKPYWYDFISGGCTIIKKEVIKKIGLFDEDYFVYWGDTDYALRAREAGFKVVMDGDTIVHHKLEISRQTMNLRKLKTSFFDNLTFINKRVKWYFKPVAYLNIFLMTITVALSVVRFFIYRILKRYIMIVRI